MDHETILESINKNRPEFLDLLGCQITSIDPEKGSCDMTFDIGKEYCHSIDVIQGGFVTAMLDSVSSHALFATGKNIKGVSTLELKVSFLKASKAGRVIAHGQIEKLGRNIAFLSAELTNEAGMRTATLTSTAMIMYS